MDKSTEYIKMCEKAEEIQAYRLFDKPFQDGDWWISLKCEDTVPCAWRSYRGEDDVWLPRQDQLQKMLIGKGILAGDWLDVLEHFIMMDGGLFEFFDGHRYATYYQKCNSMEQLWLTFVMKERWNKAWNGQEWVKEENE